VVVREAKVKRQIREAAEAQVPAISRKPLSEVLVVR
jgi:hypothetical protein